MKKLRVGVIGIGDISNVYLNNLKKYDAVEVVACASRGLEKAQRKAASPCRHACLPSRLPDYTHNVPAALSD